MWTVTINRLKMLFKKRNMDFSKNTFVSVTVRYSNRSDRKRACTEVKLGLNSLGPEHRSSPTQSHTNRMFE